MEYLELCHVVDRCEGGEPSYENLMLMCFTHNQLHQRRRMVVRGNALNPTFWHPDGRPYGEPAPGASP
jgi:hypothetical protein